MSYVSLARKYRPRRFVDMVGQETTTLALTNAIRLQREPHSVIFTGVRGVGKTTSARIYAKALNCEQGPTADPCDVCASCHAITAGNHEDVLEIDGASNTGVDDVRALQETLSYVPQRSTYKIYIIDEVHMLSISAFNALLKTLEEPPRHVVFIFATTELHKVPETIQSRCQTFHLQKISRPVIAERVRDILNAEQIPFDEAALTVVAREGRGSMRDALTMLDQAIAVGGGQVTLETLRNMVGSSQSLPVLELLDGLLRKDASQILEVIARWDQEGQAISTLAEETAKACRNAFILKDLKGQSIDLQILELEDREQAMLQDLGEKAAPMDLNRLFRQLAKCLDDLRHADLDRFILENYCLEWCFDPGLPDLQTLMNLIAGGQPFPAQAPRVAPQSVAAGEAINLRERLKTAVPQAGKPPMANRAPAPAPQTMEPPAPKPPVPQASTPLPQKPVATPPAYAAKPAPPAPPSAQQEMMPAPVPKPVVAAPAPMPASAPRPAAPVQQNPYAAKPAATPSASVPVPAPIPAAAPSPAPASNPLATLKAAMTAPRSNGATAAPQATSQPPPSAKPPLKSKADEMPAWLDDAPPMMEPPSWISEEAVAEPKVEAESFLQKMAKKAAAHTQAAAPVAPPAPAAAPAAKEEAAAAPVFPSTWREFVDEWKKQKPLQARYLEEAYVLEYSPQRIRLAVEPTSMAGGKLLQQDLRKRLLEQFALLFGFQGQLEAIPKADVAPVKAGAAPQPSNLGENLLEVKHREREIAREVLRHKLEDHPMTREVISRFGGTIEQIELQ